MIVEADFLTHWKTRALVRALDYEAAPLCVLAMWAHCQSRKTDRLNVTEAVFASICGYPFPQDAAKFLQVMQEVGFIERDGDAIVAHDFAEANAQLFANWRNGKAGGRPPRTEPKPTDNPPETQSENGLSDRLDKIGLDKKEKKGGANGSRPAPVSDEEWLKEMAAEPCYSHIRVRDEHGKMLVWCRNQRPPRAPTRKRFINWLNKIEKPMSGMTSAAAQPQKREIPESFRNHLIAAYPAKRDDIATWKTCDQIPTGLRGEWEVWKKARAT